MSFWVTSVAVPVGVSGATSIAAQLTFGPRLAARSARIQALHGTRAKLADDLLRLLIVCGALESADLSNPRTEGERARWTSQIDEITTRLIDDGPAVALTHANVLGIPVLLAQCFALPRAVWLSDKPLMQRVTEVREVAGPIQQIYGRRWWHIPANVARVRAAVAKYS